MLINFLKKFMPRYEILLPVEIGEKIREVGEVISQDEMTPAHDGAPSEWDSLIETKHIKLL